MKTVILPGFVGRSRRLARAALVTSMATTMMIMTAPGVFAQSEEEIQGACQRRGGDYQTTTDASGNTISTCCYKKVGCDVYVNGTWDHSYPLKAPPPVSGPAAPPANNAPIPTNPPPAAH